MQVVRKHTPSRGEATSPADPDDPHEDSVLESSGLKDGVVVDFRQAPPALDLPLKNLKPHELHPLALSLDKACQDSERKMASSLSLATLKEEIMAMKEQLKKIIDVQEDHIDHIAERFRLGDFTVTIKRDLTALFEDNEYCIHFRGSCDRTKNHDLHGDVSGLHLRLTLRKRKSKKYPKAILSGFIYFYPNEVEEGQTGIFCRSEIDFWGISAEAIAPKPDSPASNEEDEKQKEAGEEPKKKKSKFFGGFRSKMSTISGSPRKRHLNRFKEKDQSGGKTPSTARVPPDAKSPKDEALTLEGAQIAEDPCQPGWQKLFDMEHQYTDDGEGFGKWNVMHWEDFEKRVVKKEGKIVLRMKVSNIQRFFET